MWRCSPSARATMISDEQMPASKRRKMASEFDRVRKETFVESMLKSVAETLASDSEFGLNSANRIRTRVEQIASGLDEDTPSAERTSAGRAVVESRFALGHDDAQYLAQAVSVLWAGDGGERLRIVPPAAMPEIMRVASSRGLVRAMAGVLGTKRKEARASIMKGLDLVAWLLQVREIRVAVVHIMKESEVDAVRNASGALEQAYESGNGSTYVKSVMDNNDDKHVNRAVVRELVEAVYMIVDPAGRPSRAVAVLERNMRKVVESAASNSEAVIDVALAMDSVQGIEMTQEDAASEKVVGAGFCPEYDGLGNRLTPREIPNLRQFSAAVFESYRRLSCNHESIVAPREESNVMSDLEYSNASTAGSFDKDKNWYLMNLICPLVDDGDVVPPNQSGKLIQLLEEQGCNETKAPPVLARLLEGQSSRKSRRMKEALEELGNGHDSRCVEIARGTYDPNRRSWLPTRLEPGTKSSFEPRNRPHFCPPRATRLHSCTKQARSSSASAFSEACAASEARTRSPRASRTPWSTTTRASA